MKSSHHASTYLTLVPFPCHMQVDAPIYRRNAGMSCMLLVENKVIEQNCITVKWKCWNAQKVQEDQWLCTLRPCSQRVTVSQWCVRHIPRSQTRESKRDDMFHLSILGVVLKLFKAIHWLNCWRSSFGGISMTTLTFVSLCVNTYVRETVNYWP